jgi:glutamate formiminotransferase
MLREESQKITVVHAYADGPYDRSSFHLAGNPCAVADVASSLAIHAMDGLLILPKLTGDEVSRHPFVGLVDHVSVMPLPPTQTDKSSDTSSHGDAALSIGKRLETSGVQVFYYGDAHPERTPLAVVRREQTNFFRSGGLQQNQNGTERSTPTEKGVATVGAPATFVENFNIRLTPNCDFKLARSLTSFLRERDGGLLGVEGLTLPYGNRRYEMAGNLLRPDVCSEDAVLAKLDEWVVHKLKEFPFERKSDLIEAAYRVGTTAKQCQEAVAQCNSIEAMRRHDLIVIEQFREYLTDDKPV